MWNKIVDYFNSNIYNILIFFAVFIVGIVFIKVLLKIINKMFLKSKIEKIAQNFFVRMIKFVLYLVFILVLLSVVGVKLTGILTALSAVILAIGVALQNNIANLANVFWRRINFYVCFNYFTHNVFYFLHVSFKSYIKINIYPSTLIITRINHLRIYDG